MRYILLFISKRYVAHSDDFMYNGVMIEVVILKKKKKKNLGTNFNSNIGFPICCFNHRFTFCLKFAIKILFVWKDFVTNPNDKYLFMSIYLVDHWLTTYMVNLYVF